MWTSIIKVILQVAAGWGLANAAETYIEPILPSSVQSGGTIGKFSPLKIAWLVAIFVAAFMLLKWLGKKLNVKILK